MKTKRTPFGGRTVNFKGREETLEEVMGSEPMPPTSMMAKLWAWIRKHDLMKKKEEE